jgi:hypothetical protein
MRQCRLRHEEVGEDIGPEGLLQLFGGDLLQRRLRVLLRRVVDQDIELAELLQRAVDRLTAE